MSERIALLTGGGDKPYALGMASAITSTGSYVDFIGSNALQTPGLLDNPRIRFLNLRGDQRANASAREKIVRVILYYARLLRYAATAEPRVFHILWNNKVQLFDRTLLTLYYKLLGKTLILTCHNVNIGQRDANDSWLNRLSLRIQYDLVDHIFVHTKRMKCELASAFAVPGNKVTVIPFGINNTVPNTSLTSSEAKKRVGVDSEDWALLFFGNIAPYKGLEYVVSALTQLLKKEHRYRLLIVGRPKGQLDYWQHIERTIANNGIADRVIARIEYVPDEETELYFKAADVLILPYTYVFQSGVLFLGYSFGLPAIVADVGSLKEEIIEGRTGLVFRSQNAADLASKIEIYFQSELFHNLESRRAEIKAYANERYSWDKVAALTTAVYAQLVSSDLPKVGA